MADNKEQRVCVKFCFLLGKSAAETVWMLQEAFKDEAVSKSQVYEWYWRLKGVKCYVRTSHDPADLQPGEKIKILKKFAAQPMQIVVGPLMRFLK